jgi:hypothetical protein
MMTEMQQTPEDYLKPRGAVTRVGDESVCDRLIAQASRMMSSAELLSPLMLRKLGWHAVPVIDVVTKEAERRILTAAKLRGINKLSVVCTGPVAFGDEPFPQDYVYELDLTDNSSTDSFYPPAHPFLYFPTRQTRYPSVDDFALVFGDEHEHHTIAGPQRFVEEALGKSIQEAFANFQMRIREEESDMLKAYLENISIHNASFAGN